MGGSYLVQTAVGVLLAIVAAAGWISYYLERTEEEPLATVDAGPIQSSRESISSDKALDIPHRDPAVSPDGSSSLRKKYAALQREHAALQNEIHTLRTRSGRLEARLADTIESRDALASRLDSAQSERTRLTGELETMQARRARLAEQMDSGETGQHDLRTRIDSTDEAIKAKEAELRSAQRQIEELREERDAIQARLESAQSGQAELRARIEDLNEQIQTKEAALRASRERIAGLREQRDELQTRLRRARGGRDTVRARFEATGERIRAKEAELGDLRRRIDSLAGSLDSAESEIGSLTAEVQRQKTARIRERERFARLKAQLEAKLQGKDVQIEHLRDDLHVIRVGGDVLFNQGSTDLRPAGAETLRAIADVLKAYPEREISLEGHTDNVPIGTTLQAIYPSNWELSAARAARAARFLQNESGIDPDRLRIVGYGDHQPITSNEKAKGKARNRRIEIRLLPPSDEPTIVQHPWAVTREPQ